jgi:NAD(P)-dependent dehydrogenase (short-subunit alcohol dehydrogenase family)
MNMTGKRVVITGGSSGLSLALTQILAALDDRFVRQAGTR